MALDITFALIVAATANMGLLAGASLDQSLKQLPARHRIGPVAYSQYSRASDLANGLPFYGILGVGAVLLNVAAAIVALVQRVASPAALWIFAGAGLAVLHTLVTTQAAPTNFSQRNVPANDEAGLATVIMDP